MDSILQRFSGARLGVNAATALVIWGLLTWLNQVIDPLMSYYLATTAMYATAMFGMTILLGLSGQVSLGNGALMAIGGYIFAVTSMNWQTVPLLGTPWNAVWSMVFAGVGGVVFGAAIGGIAARLRGPYLAGLTLGIAVGVPAIANRFPGLLGGENGLMLQVPYPEGGYASQDVGSEEETEESSDIGVGDEPVYEELPDEFADQGELSGGDDFLTEDDFLSEDDMLTEDDILTEDDFLSEDDMLTEDDFLSDEDFSTDEGFDTELVEEDLLTDDDFLSEEDFTTDEGFEASVDVGADSPNDGDAGGGSEFVGGSDPAAELDLAGLDSDFVIEQWQASVAIAVACVVGFVALNLVRGRQGRVWKAVRDDPIAAAVSGISPAGSKISAFVVSSLFAALAGAVFAQILSYVGPGAFTLGLSLSLLVGVVLGGRNSFIGAIIGAVILVWLPEFVLGLSADRGWQDQITNNAPNFIYGLLVVLVVLVAPGGIVGGVQGLVGRFRSDSRAG